MIDLSPKRARAFRITHVDNLPWVLKNGLHCRNSTTRDDNYVEIGNPDLISKRAVRVVPVKPGGTLSDYVPFYFTPYSPMLYNIRTGYGGIARRPMDEIAILVTSLPTLRDQGVEFLFTDRHAYLLPCVYFRDVKDLERVDWKILQARDFKRDAADPAKFERYQAEVLVHRHMPVSALHGIVCHSAAARLRIEKEASALSVDVEVNSRPDFFF